MNRHVPLAGQSNFRDLGGYATADGREVKWGMVYRAGELNELTEDDVVMLGQLGIKTVVDLRSTQEIDARGEARIPEGTRVLPTPIASALLGSKLIPLLLDGDFSKIPENLLATVNRGLVTDCQEQFAALLSAVADPGQRPLVFNCTQGKDRTGFGAAVILSALGVPWDTIVEDYLLSNVYREKDNEKLLALIRGFVTEQHEDEVDLSRISALLVVEESNINAARAQVMESYGSFEVFIHEALGFSNSELERLRDDLLS